MKALALAQKLLALPLFTRREEIKSKPEIIKWWELRRIPFNIIIGITGIVTCAVIAAVSTIASNTFGEPLGLPNPPIVAILGIIAYGIAANVCFTFGWLIEILVRPTWQNREGAFAQISFSLGLLFSVIVTLLPAILFLIVLAIRLIVR